jgi:hypothetical protein
MALHHLSSDDAVVVPFPFADRAAIRMTLFTLDDRLVLRVAANRTTAYSATTLPV